MPLVSDERGVDGRPAADPSADTRRDTSTAETLSGGATGVVPSTTADVGVARQAVAELLGTALLLAAVVGSGIMASRLFPGQDGLALLANSIATGGALFALIHAFGVPAGASFNPIVTLTEPLFAGARPGRWAVYVIAQVVGAAVGVLAAHVMFDLPLAQASTHARAGAGQWAGEFTATFGLVAVIAGCARRTPAATPAAVAAYITGAYWFTSSTSFANPAVTLARSFTDTFAGIRAADVPAFVIAQACGAVAAALLMRWLVPSTPSLPHSTPAQPGGTSRTSTSIHGAGVHR